MPVVTGTNSSTSSAAASGGDSHTTTIRAGDTLSSVADDHGVSLQALLDANPQISDPNRIHAGQVINLPASGASDAAAAHGASGAAATSPVDAVAPAGGDPDPLGDNTVTGSQGSTLPTTGRPALSRNANGPQVRDLQQLLTDAGARPGGVDGAFGPGTERGVKTFQAAMGLPVTGVADPATWAALEAGQTIDAQPSAVAENVSPRTPYGQYEPEHAATKALFRGAAQAAGLPESWADSDALHRILFKESNGRVGIPNYTYGSRKSLPSRWAQVRAELLAGYKTERSSATGLGQLTLPNVEAYYPDGAAGIGDPHNEAVGMLRYIEGRYGTPEAALAFHQQNNWY
jgi:peptidoglycan hydrolase-like protein with peptidoglycan-binding domain